MPRRNRNKRDLRSRNTITEPIEGCEGKTAYLDAPGAARALKKIKRRRKITGARVYHCVLCGDYHIGRS